MTGFLLSLFSLTITGAFFTLLLTTRSRRRYCHSTPEFLALSFFLGAGFVSCQLLLYHLFGIGFSLPNLIIVPAVLSVPAILLYVSKRGRGEAWVPAFAGMTMGERFLAAGLVVQFLWTVLLVFPVPVHSHDAVANYALKAKMFHFAGGVPGGFFSWSESTVAHPDYPPLLPFLMTWTYAFTAFNDLTVNMLMPAIYLAFIVLFYSQMKRFFGARRALFCAFLLATIPQLADYATVIHADLVLAAFVTCALIYFVLYVRTKDRVHLVLSSLFFGFSLWVKNEAMVFTGAFAAALAAFTARRVPSRRRRTVADMVIAFAIIAALGAPWFAVKSLSAAANIDIDLTGLTPARLWQNVKDIPVLLDLFQQEVFGPKKWNIFWIMVFAGMVWKRKKLWKDECFYVTLFLALSALGYFTGYMLTTGNNLYFYVNTTISRFMLHFCGAALVLLAFLVRDDVEGVMR